MDDEWRLVRVIVQVMSCKLILIRHPQYIQGIPKICENLLKTIPGTD